MALPPDNMNDLLPQGIPGAAQARQMEGQVSRPPTRMLGNSPMAYWMREPLYMTRWTYLHRPSVWNRMGGTRGFEWHGLYGFKSIFAGGGGIGYGGEARTAPAAMQWILRGGGRGFEEVGRAFTRAGTRMDYLLHLRRYSQVTGSPTLQDFNLFSRTMSGIGVRMSQFGGGFRTGGVAGGLEGLGATRFARGVETVFGGKATRWGAFTTEGIRRGFTPAYLQRLQGIEDVVQRQVAARAGVRHFFSRRARRGLQREIVAAAGPTGWATLGPAGRAGVGRAIAFRGATRLAAGATVALNVALFGGILASLAQAGTRYIGETAWKLASDTRIPSLEFGRGVNPFMDPASMTERRRALQAIQSSQLNARRFIGQEAALMGQQSY